MKPHTLATRLGSVLFGAIALAASASQPTGASAQCMQCVRDVQVVSSGDAGVACPAGFPVLP